MKNKFRAFLKTSAILLLAAAGLYFIICASVPRVVKKILQKELPGSKIQVLKSSLYATHLQISGLTIKGSSYQIDLPESILYFSPLRIRLIRPQIHLTANPLQNELRKNTTGSAPASSSAVFINSLEIDSMRIDAALPDAKIQMQLSCEADLRTQTLQKINAHISQMEMAGLRASDVQLTASTAVVGTLRIRELGYKKVKFENIDGRTQLTKEELKIEQLTADFLGDSLLSDLTIRLTPQLPYSGTLSIQSLNLALLLQTFEFNKKVDAKAQLVGTIKIQGQLDHLNSLTGELKSDASGGTLIVKDQAFLQNLADRTKQPLATIEASFKEYRFDSGSIKLTKQDSSLGLDVRLDGPAGKRDLSVQFHDVL